jgi:outer membrane biogenesis lipoprotein LolB
MTASIDYLPIWKKGAPTHERLYELAEIARKHPERFARWVIVYCEVDDKQFVTRTMSGEQTRTLDCLGVLQSGMQRLWYDSHKD